jgi:hypothetical protein
MPAGKAAGVRCVQLDPANRCRIFGQPRAPQSSAVSFMPSQEMCGTSTAEALTWLTKLETRHPARHGDLTPACPGDRRNRGRMSAHQTDTPATQNG